MVASNPDQTPDSQIAVSKASRFGTVQFWLSTAIPCYLIFRAWQRVDTEFGRLGRMTGTSIAYCVLAGAWVVYWAYRHFIRPRILHRRHHEYLNRQFDLATEKMMEQKLEEAVALLGTAVWCRGCEAWVTDAMLLRSTINRLLGKYREAADDAEALCEIDPTNLEYVAQLASLQTGAPDDSVRNVDNAQELVEYGMSTGDDSDGVFLRIQAAIHAERGEFAKAIVCYERGIKSEPAAQHFADNLARLKNKQSLRFNAQHDRAKYFEQLAREP